MFIALSILSGDAIEAQLIQSGVSRDIVMERQAALGLLDPLPVRYVRFWRNALRGELGESLITREPVAQIIARNVGPTLTLALATLIVASASGIALGIITILYRGSFSLLSKALINLALSTPIYWTGTLTIYFTVQSGLVLARVDNRLDQLILPVIVLAFHTAGPIARVTAANLQSVLHEDFVRTAYAKGLHKYQIMIKHVFRVGLLPSINVITLQAGFLLGGTVIIESLFVRPGIGRLLLDAVRKQDYPIVLGVVMLSAGVYAVLNLMADVLMARLDPRVLLR